MLFLKQYFPNNSKSVSNSRLSLHKKVVDTLNAYTSSKDLKYRSLLCGAFLFLVDPLVLRYSQNYNLEKDHVLALVLDVVNRLQEDILRLIENEMLITENRIRKPEYKEIVALEEESPTSDFTFAGGDEFDFSADFSEPDAENDSDLEGII